MMASKNVLCRPVPSALLVRALPGLARPAHTPLRGSQALQRTGTRQWAAVVAQAGDGGSANQQRPRSPAEVPELAPGTLLDGGRFEVLEPIGSGANAVTYRARDRQADGREVAIKVLSLRSLRDWKQLELFEREAKVLENLDHPGIPRYLASFEEDTEDDRTFCLVQELAQGRSLEDLVASGWRADEAEVTRIATELLRILAYLGSRRPPVTHRDVKPSNIVLEGGRAGGRVFLVDFGGVQAASAVPGGLGSTMIVGTYGFMAPEAFRGAASPASDLYGLGATLLYLLSGRPPSAFPLDRMRLDFSSVVMGPQLESVIDGLLEPVAEDRLTADEALGLLSGVAAAGGARSAASRDSSAGGSVRLRQPAGSKIKVIQRGPRLEVDIPPAGFSGDSLATGAFAIAWNAFVAVWTVGALTGGGVLFALFSLPFWFVGAKILKQAFGRQFIRERLLIGPKSWRLEQQLAVINKGKADWEEGSASREEEGRTADLQGARVDVVAYVNGVPQTQLELVEGVNRHVLAEGLDPVEQEWLAAVINEHLQQHGGGSLSDPGSSRPLLRSASSPVPMDQYLGGGQGAQPPAWQERTDRSIAEVQRSAAEGAARAREAGRQAQRAGDRGAALGGSRWRGQPQEHSTSAFDDEDPFDSI